MKSPNLRKMNFIESKPHLELFLGRFHGGFLIWDELIKICGFKMGENAKSCTFLGKNP